MFSFFIEVRLSDNVLISSVQQSDSVMYMYTFFSIVAYHGILNIVLGAL